MDESGYVWLFGGLFVNSSVYQCNNLWRYNPTNKAWAWMTGSAKSCAVAAVTQVPGTRYTPSVSNVLGTMFGTTVTADKKGSLWVFGGSNNSSNYNTLWRYSESTNLWTWMAGSGSISGTGTGGVIGAELATYTPPAVVYPATTADESGNIWLFGGSGTSYNQNGLWRFNTTTNMWALMGGTASAAGIIYSVRGNSGVESATYTPGARYNSAMWYDEHGYIWIFGGTGYSTASVGYLNDLWRYNIATQQWAWISGSPTTADATGSSMGTQNQINSNNIIGSRRGVGAWYYNNYAYQFGGVGYDSVGTGGTLNTFSRTKLYTN